MAQRDLLINVGKKMKEWGLSEYDTTLGPKPVKCWRFDKFQEVVKELADIAKVEAGIRVEGKRMVLLLSKK